MKRSSTKFRKQALEPVNRTGGLNAYTHRPLQAAIKRVGLPALMIQTPLGEQLSCCVVDHGDLLVACVKIASYNKHRPSPLFRASAVEQLPSLLGSRSRRLHPISLRRP